MEPRGFAELVRWALGAQPDPPLWLIPATGVIALAVVLYWPAWRVARNVITIVHEGGHASAALLTGRRLRGIRLHSDTSGVTVSVGRPTGLGMIVTVFAGYTAPSAVGVAYAAVLALDRVTLLLWGSIGLLALLLLAIRNMFGVFAVVATGGLVFAVSWFGSVLVQSGFAYLTWFLLLGGVWPVLELQRKRRRRQAPDSDADQLSRLTGVAGMVWVVVFGLFAVGAAVLGGRWLLL
ncbi:MAG TPA: M50 family metallopeptidase [Micromonosporaceae bacterium]